MKTSRYMRHVIAVLVAMAVTMPSSGSSQEDDLRQRALALNNVTGDEPIIGQVRALKKDEAVGKKLIAAALPMAKEKDQPFNFNGAYILAQVALQLREHDASQVFFRVCLEQAAKLGSSRKLEQALDGLQRNIAVLFAEKKYEESAKLTQELLETLAKHKVSQETQEELLRHWIRALAKGGKSKDADNMLENLLKVRGQDWQNVELRAWYYREAGRFEEAIKTYEDALSLLEKEKDEDWIRHADRLAGLHRNLAQVYFNLKNEEKYTQHTKKCAETYENLLKQIAKSNEITEGGRAALTDGIRYLLSGVYVELNDIDKAIDQLKQLVAAHPDHPSYNNDLGYIMADNDRDLDEAEKLIRKALDEDRKNRQAGEPDVMDDDKDNAAYLDSLGWVLFKKKQYADAKKYLLKAIEDPKEGQHIEIYDHLGDVHMALGEKAAAIAAWKKGIEVIRDIPREHERKLAVEKKLKEHAP